MSDAQLESLRRAGRLQLLDPLPAPLLAKVRQCAMLSLTIAIEHADILEDQELVD